MRFTLNYHLNKELLPVSYRPIFISAIKNVLSSYRNGELFSHYYRDTIEKPFTFAVTFGKCNFTSDKITVPEKRLQLHFSTSDPIAGIHFYNAFMEQRGRSYPLPEHNCMTLTGFNLNREVPITDRQILCNFIAPLCIRIHDKATNKDTYLTYQDQNFESELKSIIKYQIQNIPLLTEEMAISLQIVPIRCKKVMVKHYEHCIPATVGTFMLTGEPSLLNYLYQAGMGSRKSSGFGYFNIVQQGGDA